ncbi:hypothetical protein HAX54_024398 [Datura stramonium]|uniref:Uncharacterized protein n=1 Tax=Datura stramonium TaxID=4076 RepID=A0ABS8UY52_DATST|nr:hypothetical protein [Datura stramonium]
MAPNGGGVNNKNNNGTSLSRNHIGGGGGTRQVLKKGPWTTTEDAILMEYVKKHGEGNWNAVQRNSGLIRCGKSCRLRWANHLRPHLKKGAFSLEEERLIVELHAKLGNKWARMAAQGYSSSMPMSQLQHNYPNFTTTTTPFSGISLNHNGLILGMGTEHRSMRETTTTSSDADNYAVNRGLSRGNSGLLEDLLEESQTLTRGDKIEENCGVENEDSKGKLVWEEYGLTEEAAEAIFTEDSSSLNSSSGITTKEASLELGNQVDDDIMRFLDNFPLGVPVPDWCDDHQNTSNGQSFECDQIQLSSKSTS